MHEAKVTQWLTYLFEGIRQSEDACSYEGDEDVGENLDTTIRTVIVHLPDSTSAVRLSIC